MRHNTITAAMLDETTYEKTADQHGAYWRLEQAPGEPLEAFSKRVWFKHAQVMQDHIVAC